MFDLKGNNYSKEKIEKWYREEEIYHNQFKGGRGEKYWIIDETFNEKYTFNKFINLSSESKVLSFGCAEGNDLEKIYKKNKFKLYGIEASAELIKAFNKKFPEAEIKKSNIYGNIDYNDNFFDYVMVLGVLHHIPNMSFVLSELYRVLKRGGKIIIREPISSMKPKNKWGKNDKISPNERGIPVNFMKSEMEKLGFRILSVSKAYWAPLMRVIKIYPFLQNYPVLIYYIDKLCCSIPIPIKYYRENIFSKCAPGAAYYIAEKLR